MTIATAMTSTVAIQANHHHQSKILHLSAQKVTRTQVSLDGNVLYLTYARCQPVPALPRT